MDSARSGPNFFRRATHRSTDPLKHLVRESSRAAPTPEPPRRRAKTTHAHDAQAAAPRSLLTMARIRPGPCRPYAASPRFRGGVRRSEGRRREDAVRRGHAPRGRRRACQGVPQVRGIQSSRPRHGREVQARAPRSPRVAPRRLPGNRRTRSAAGTSEERSGGTRRSAIRSSCGEAAGERERQLIRAPFRARRPSPSSASARCGGRSAPPTPGRARAPRRA